MKLKFYAFKLTKEQDEKIRLDKEPIEMLQARLIRFPADGKPIPCGFVRTAAEIQAEEQGDWMTKLAFRVSRELRRIRDLHTPLGKLGYNPAQWDHNTPVQKKLEERKAGGEMFVSHQDKDIFVYGNAGGYVTEVEIDDADFAQYARPLSGVHAFAPGPGPGPAHAPGPAPATPAPAPVVAVIDPAPASAPAPAPVAPIRFVPAAPLAPLAASVLDTAGAPASATVPRRN